MQSFLKNIYTKLYESTYTSLHLIKKGGYARNSHLTQQRFGRNPTPALITTKIALWIRLSVDYFFRINIAPKPSTKSVAGSGTDESANSLSHPAVSL